MVALAAPAAPEPAMSAWAIVRDPPWMSFPVEAAAEAKAGSLLLFFAL
jgi:hypothetical protein